MTNAAGEHSQHDNNIDNGILRYMNDQRDNYVIAPVMLLPRVPIAASAVAFTVGNRKCHIAIVNRIDEAGREHLIKFYFLFAALFSLSLYSTQLVTLTLYSIKPRIRPAQSLLLVAPQTISA